MLQPLDVSVFKALKSHWEKAKLTWKAFHPYESITKKHFSMVLKNVVTKVTTETLRMVSDGLFPFNPNEVDYTKCVIDQQIHDIEELVMIPICFI